MKTRNYLLACLFAFGGHALFAQEQALVDTTQHAKSLYEMWKKEDARPFTSHMHIQFCTSFTSNFNDFSVEEATFKLNRLRMEILGRFLGKFGYRFRYTYNKYTNPNTVDNLSTHIELANMDWDVSKFITLKAGKQFFLLGGYEYYVTGIRVRQFSDFNNYTQSYLTGVSGTFHLTPTQDLSLQVANNRVETESQINTGEGQASVPKVPLMGTLNWTGRFLDDGALQFYYGAAAGQILRNRNIYYLTFGNVWERGPVLAYVDCMYSREEVDSKGLITAIHAVGEDEKPMTAQYVQYLSWIGNLDYRLHPKWNMFVKGVYEWGGVYKTNRIYERGIYRKSWNAQLCLEYYPLKRNDLQLFLHLSYKKYHFAERAKALGGADFSEQQIMLGLLYTIPVF